MSGRRLVGESLVVSSSEEGKLTDLARKSSASSPFETAETLKLSFLTSRMAICLLISSVDVSKIREHVWEPYCLPQPGRAVSCALL